MDKNIETLMVDVRAIQTIAEVYQALDTIEVRGFSNIKTLSNCMEAIKKVIEVINEQNPATKSEVGVEDGGYSDNPDTKKNTKTK